MTDNRLAIYAERDVVRELADRLEIMHPAAKEVGKAAMITVAQMAIMTGANPLPGKNGIHVYLDNKGKLVFQFGIGYWRSQAEKAGGISWATRPRIMTDEERQAYGIAPNEIGAICEGALWSEVRRAMAIYRENGERIPLSEARRDVAAIGIGTVRHGDYAKNGRPLSWTALERCERDLLRTLVPDMAQRESGEISAIGGADWELAEFIRMEPGEQETDQEPVEVDDINALFFGAVEGEFTEIDIVEPGPAGDEPAVEQDVPDQIEEPAEQEEDLLAEKRSEFLAAGVEVLGNGWTDQKQAEIIAFAYHNCNGKADWRKDIGAVELKELTYSQLNCAIEQLRSSAKQ